MPPSSYLLKLAGIDRRRRKLVDLLKLLGGAGSRCSMADRRFVTSLIGYLSQTGVFSFKILIAGEAGR
jgi:hypothetical protein